MSAQIIKFAKKGVSIATGWDAGKRVVRTARALVLNEQATAGAAEVKSMWQRLLVRRRPARSETFAEAQCRLKVTDADIAARRNELALDANIFRVLTVASLAGGIYSMAGESSEFMMAAVGVVTLCAVLMFGGLVFSRAFRVWQIDRRELASVEQFFRDCAWSRIFFGG